MNILVTGGAGFIGSNLIQTLLAKGNQVRTIDNLATGRIENLTGFIDNPAFGFLEGTVTDREVMEPLVAWCDQCYHLAAPVGVKYIMDNPVLTILDNVRGMDVMLELVNKYKKRILIASTSEIYGKSLDLLDASRSRKLKEDDYRVEGSTRNHRWAYANTKAMDEFLAFAYHKEYGTDVVIVRFFNTVGPRQLGSFGMVIPNFVARALADEEVVVYGTGEQRRSFLHVKDAVRAVTTLMERSDITGEEFNVGNPFEVTMNELANLVIEKTGSSSTLRHVSYEEIYGPGFEDMDRRTADITKLKETIGFEIQNDLDGILNDVIEHMRAQMSAKA
ncbi:MAG: GDP-mannose 4,6-dehydratase [Bacteroidia bacterium]